MSNQDRDMSNQIEQIRAVIERRNLANYCGTAEQYEEELFAILDTIEAEKKEHPVPADVPEAAKKYADEQLLGHNRELAESGHTRHFKMGYVCFAGYDIEAAFANGMLADRERLASCPTIKGWVARDGHGSLAFSSKKPARLELWKLWKVSRDTPAVFLPNTLFPALRWEDEPREVEIIVKLNQTTLK